MPGRKVLPTTCSVAIVTDRFFVANSIITYGISIAKSVGKYDTAIQEVSVCDIILFDLNQIVLCREPLIAINSPLIEPI